MRRKERRPRSIDYVIAAQIRFVHRRVWPNTENFQLLKGDVRVRI